MVLAFAMVVNAQVIIVPPSTEPNITYVLNFTILDDFFNASAVMGQAQPAGLNVNTPDKYSFTANKKYLLIVGNTTTLTNSPDSRIYFEVMGEADDKGNVQFEITLPRSAWVDFKTKQWQMFILLVDWPAPGFQWLIYNVTSNFAQDRNLTYFLFESLGGRGFNNSIIRSPYVNRFYVKVVGTGGGALAFEDRLVFTYTLNARDASVNLWEGGYNGTVTNNEGAATFGPLFSLGTLLKQKPYWDGTMWVIEYDNAAGTLNYTITVVYEPSPGVTYTLITFFGSVAPYSGKQPEAVYEGTAPPPVLREQFINATIYPLRFPGVDPDFTSYTGTVYAFNGTLVTLLVPIITVRGNIFDLKENNITGLTDEFNELNDAFLVKAQLMGTGANPITFDSANVLDFKDRGVSIIVGTVDIENDEVAITKQNVKPKIVVEYIIPTEFAEVRTLVLEVPITTDNNGTATVDLTVGLMPIVIYARKYTGDHVSNAPFLQSNIVDRLTVIMNGKINVVSKYLVRVNDQGRSVIYLPPFIYTDDIDGYSRPQLGQERYPLDPYVSGWIATPTLVGEVYDVGVGTFRLYNYSDAAAQGFIRDYGIALLKSTTYSMEIFYDDVRVGAAKFRLDYPTVVEISPGFFRLYDAASSSANVTKYDDYFKAYELLATREFESFDEDVQPVWLFNVELELDIAVNVRTVEVLIRDYCGEPIFYSLKGIPTNAIIVESDGRVLGTFSIGSELPITVPVEVDEWGAPIAATVPLRFKLAWYGYEMYASHIVFPNGTLIATDTIDILTIGSIKPEIRFPITKVNFQVWSRTVEGVEKEELVGFVVSIFSVYTGDEMWRGISNKSGEVLAYGLPLGQPVTVRVRTIIPEEDEAWTYFDVQNELSQSYETYRDYMLEDTPADVKAVTPVYTLGTRGEFDAGRVVYEANFTATEEYACAKKTERLFVDVYDIEIRLYDMDGNLLKSQFVYPCAIPSYCPAVLYNVTMVIFDEFSPYEDASKYANRTQDLVRVLTDFRTVGMTGMRSIFERIAAMFEDDMVRAFQATPEADLVNYLRNATFFATAKWLAGASTDSLEAVFRLESRQPKDGPLRPEEIGTEDLARLFMRGQKFRLMVYYLGYKVFDGYITITSPRIDVTTAVKGIRFDFITKRVSEAGNYYLPVNALVGVTFTDALFATFNETQDDTTVMLRQPYLGQLTFPFPYIVQNVTQVVIQNRTLPATYNVTDNSLITAFSRQVEQIGGTYSFLSYLLPNSMAFTPMVDGKAYDTLWINTTKLDVSAWYMVLPYINITTGNAEVAPLGMDRWVRAIDGSILNSTYFPDYFDFYRLLTNEIRLMGTVVPSGATYVKVVGVSYPGGVSPVDYFRFTLTSGEELLSLRIFETYVRLLGGATVSAAYANVTMKVTFGNGTTITYGPFTADVSGFFADVVTPALVPVRVRVFVTLTANGVPVTDLVAKWGEYDVQQVEIQVALWLVGSGDYDEFVYYSLPDYAYLTTAVPALVTNRTVPLYDYYTDAVDTARLVRTIYPPKTDISGYETAFGNTYNWTNFFGSPFTVIVRSGEAFPMPWWYVDTALFGTRIARLWVMGFDELDNREFTVNLGVGEAYTYRRVDGLVSYDIRNYTLLNYYEPPEGRIATSYLGAFGTATTTAPDAMYALGAGTGGTSALLFGLDNITKATPRDHVFETIGLAAVKVQNSAEFGIVVVGVNFQGNSIEAVSYVTVPSGARGLVKLKEPIYGASLSVITYRATRIEPNDLFCDLVCAEEYKPALSVTVKYDPTPTAEWADQFMEEDFETIWNAILAAEEPFTTGTVNFDLLYAGAQIDPLEPFETVDVPYPACPLDVAEFTLLAARIAGFATYGIVLNSGNWEAWSTDEYAKVVFDIGTLPLEEVRDWNDRPLANQTVALFNANNDLVAVIFTTNNGTLYWPLPYVTGVVRVGWFYGYIATLVRGQPQYTIWTYDSSITNDVLQLGDALNEAKVRTYTYPLTLVVRDVAGAPLPNTLVEVKDRVTGGELFYFSGRTGSDGSIVVYEPRVSSYVTGPLSQVPPTDLDVVVFYEASPAVPVASQSVSIQRGATVPSQGINIEINAPIITAATTGGIPLVSLVSPFGTPLDGARVRVELTGVDRVFETTASGGVVYAVGLERLPTQLLLDGRVVPVAARIDVIEWRGIPVEGEEPIEVPVKPTVESRIVTAIGKLVARAVDGFGRARPEWQVTVLYGDRALEAGPTVEVELPAGTYTVRTTAFGREWSVDARLEGGRVVPAIVEVPTARVVAKVVDGFGEVRDWPVDVACEGVTTSGTGSVEVEVLEGQCSVSTQVSIAGKAFSDTVSDSVRKGEFKTITVMVPTARIVAQAVDGFGTVRDWPVEVVGVASGTGRVEADVLEGTYTVRVRAFGQEFTQSASATRGQVATVSVEVPTGRIRVVALDDSENPLPDKYVSAVEIYRDGQLVATLQQGGEVELLEGSYTVRVTAFGGRTAETTATVEKGRARSVGVVVPGTAGVDIAGVRIPMTLFFLGIVLLIVVVILIAILILEYSNWRRRRIAQLLVPPK